jgi:Ca-activated chloride channel homolog
MPAQSQFPFITLAVLLTLSPFTLSQQQNKPANSPGDLILMTVTVKTRSGGYASGLNREVFALTDQKEARSIEFFDNTDSPVSVGILVDTSESMQLFGLKELARPGPVGEAMVHMLQVGNPNNEYFLAAFDKTTRFLTEWKNGRALLAEKIQIGQQNKATALYDACYAAIEKLGTGRYPRKVLVLISDGQDNESRHSFNELRDLLRKSDIAFYAVGIPRLADVGSSLGVEGVGVMAELAEVTGGECFLPENNKQMSVAMNLLATQLRNQYRIGFRANKNDPSNKWRRLTVKVTLPADAPREFGKLKIRTRQGYFTP